MATKLPFYRMTSCLGSKSSQFQSTLHIYLPLVQIRNLRSLANVSMSHHSCRYFSKKKQLDKKAVMDEWRSKYDRSELTKDYEVEIPYEKLDISCTRSSGPGGQNVNKVATKVEIRIDLDKCNWIPEEVIERLKVREKNRINKHNEFILVCDTHRTQYDNRNEANKRLKELIDDCCYPERERVDSDMPKEYKELIMEREKFKRQKKSQKRDIQKRGW